VRRIGYAVATFLLVAGIFWSGRESVHGLGAVSDHWWCPIPLVAIVAGLATTLLLARSGRQTS